MATPPVTQTGCEKLRFEPTIEAAPTTGRADAPSGLDVRLHVPQDEDPEGLATPQPKDVRLTLPEGLVVNPASADGLAACSMAEIGFEQDGAPNGEPVSCPEASKLGTVTATTPLLAEKLHGYVYLAAQDANPFHSLLALYLTLEDPERGVLVKLAGEVEPDPHTGRLTTVFRNNPQLPVEDLEVSLKQGARAPLRTPRSCGAHAVTSTITPWSAPATPDARPSSSFRIAAAPGGGACQAAGNSPAFAAGTEAPAAGRYSPFDLHLARADGSQELSRIETTLPTGLLARLGGVAECTDAQLAAATANGGRAEQAQPSCPASARIGTVDVAAGAGPAPLRVKGTAYLAGPYRGAPLSLAVITPAVAGPFDLGTVVVRAALDVDLTTAQVRAVSDPIPTVVKGIPLDVRSIALHLDRSRFTLNPTSCDPTQVASTITSASGASAHPASRFQVGGCGALRFKPKLELQLKGATKRSGHPALKAVLTYPKRGRYANISRAQVGLPHSEFLDQGNLNKVCKQADLHAGTCPKSSIYGHAKAWTPLLDKALEGPVYLGVGFGYKLPALVADLNGRIRILLVGRVDTTKRHGVRSTFQVVPDAPVSRFVLTMKGGKRYGLLENSENTCRSTQRASALFTAQNGDRLHLRPKIANGCGGKKHRRASHARRRAAGHPGAHGSSTSPPAPLPQGGPSPVDGPVPAAAAQAASGAATPSTAGGCPNEAVRIEQHATYLPACRAYELVGPGMKNSSVYAAASISPDGERVLYAAPSADAQIALSTRATLAGGLGRWQQESLLPPTDSWPDDGNGVGYGVNGITPDRRIAFFSSGMGSVPFEASPAVLGRLDGGGARTIFATVPGTQLAGTEGVATSDDGRHAFIDSEHRFDLAQLPGTFAIYDLGAGPLLVSRLPDGKVPSCGAARGFDGGFMSATHESSERQYWASASGRYIFFLSRGNGPCLGTAAAPLELYRRDLTAERTDLISGPAISGDSDAVFLRASADGSSVAFETSAQLVPADGNGHPDVYRWRDSAGSECLTCVVPDAAPEPLTGGLFETGIGVSADLSRVYFVSQNDLAAGGHPGEPNIYVLHGGQLHYVAPAAGVGSLADQPSFGATMTPTGSMLVFRSDDPSLNALTEPQSDNAGLAQYYRYDAEAEHIVCVSCAPGGQVTTEVPQVMAAAQSGTSYSQVLSDDGSRFFFVSEDALVPGDRNRSTDIYEWHNGHLGLITDGVSSTVGGNNPAVTLRGISAHGDDVLFTAFTPYTASAGDRSQNLFDARIGGGEAGATVPAVCEGEACQPPATPAPPVAAAPGSETFTSPGNPHRGRSCGKGRRKVRRGGKVRCVRRHAGHKHHRGHRRHRPHRGKRKG